MGNARVNHGKQIVTDGLVLYLDAANPKSYPGSGTAVTDISYNGNNGTLINGVGYNSESFILDGINDYINMGNILNYTSSNFSFNFFIKLSSLLSSDSSQGPVIFYKGNYATNGYYLQIDSTNGITFITNNSGSIKYTRSNLILSLINYSMITVTRLGTSVKIYVNSIDVTSISGVHSDPSPSSSNFTIGVYPNPFYMRGSLPIFQSYNKALSQAEVTQNFNALRGRFGI